jgi:chemotaxis protein MotA
LDIGTIAGLGLAVCAIVGSTLMDGGSINALFSPSALVLVIGGTVGVTIISNGLQPVLGLPKLLAQTLRSRAYDPQATIDRLVQLAQKARREGLLSLESEIADIDDQFLARGLQMVVDGSDIEAVRSVLETDIAFMERRHSAGFTIFETAGGYAPTMGIIGTVMGLIHVLTSLADPGRLGAAIASAFLATFYGISTANVFWLPIASQLKAKTQRETDGRALCLEGILSIQSGDNPSTVRDKLAVFLPPSVVAKGGAGGGEGGPGEAAAQAGGSGG